MSKSIAMAPLIFTNIKSWYRIMLMSILLKTSCIFIYLRGIVYLLWSLLLEKLEFSRIMLSWWNWWRQYISLLFINFLLLSCSVLVVTKDDAGFLMPISRTISPFLWIIIKFSSNSWDYIELILSWNALKVTILLILLAWWKRFNWINISSNGIGALMPTIQ